MFLHGFLASSQYFKHVTQELETTHTVVRLNLLGHGRSPRTKNIDYTYEQHLAAIHHTLIALNIKNYILVGHSMGAMIALRYAKMYPVEVRRVILLNPPLFSNRQEALSDIAASHWYYRAFLFWRGRNVLWNGLRFVPRSRADGRGIINLTDMLRVDNRARQHGLEHIIAHGNVLAELPEISQPTLLVVGQKDRPTYHKNLRRAVLPTHTTLVRLPYGHNGLAYRGNELGELIRTHAKEATSHTPKSARKC